MRLANHVASDVTRARTRHIESLQTLITKRKMVAKSMSQSTVSFEHLCSISKHALSLTIRWNAVRIIILFRQSRSCAGSYSVENVFIDRYNMAYEMKDFEEMERISDEMVHVVADIGREPFDAIAAAAETNSSAVDCGNLDMFMFPPEHAFTFRTVVSGTTRLVPDEARPMHGVRSARTGLPLFILREGCTLPLYSTRDVRVLEGLGRSGCVARVQIDGRELCAKTAHVPARRAGGGSAAQREADQLWKMTASGTAGTLRVPHLVGFLYTPKDARLVGFLQEYVPAPEASTPRTLGSIETPSDVPEPRRRKWATQVRETVDALHGMGVVWGDGKADNVLVHRDSDDAWVVGLGGGWTEGWVAREQSGSMESDNVAVKRIFECLGLAPP